MPLLLSPHHHVLLLFLVAVAASHGDSSGATYNSSMCLNQTYKCGELSISYPFYLSSETEELNGYNNSYSYCGYPGLGIICDDDKPILQLSGTANYTVKSIDGASANVSLADPEVVNGSCPRVDHNVTFAPGAWLDFPASTVDYIVFFLSCYFGSGLFQPPTLDPITCSEFGLPGVSFVLLNTSVPPGNWSQACLKVIQVPVLKYEQADPNDPAWGDTGYSKVLRKGFQVSWDNRPVSCTQCEESNGRCAYNQTGEFQGCLCTNGQIDVRSCTTYNSTGKYFSI
jgi:hypothetical protein